MIADLIKIVFLPLRLVTNLIYGQPKIAGYGWYDKTQYNKLLRSTNDEDLIPTYDAWLEHAKHCIEELERKQHLVIRVDIKINKLEKWLSKRNLDNTSVNREKYIGHIVAKTLNKGIHI
jgi:hypothetical protein